MIKTELKAEDLVGLFEQIAEIFAERKEQLCKMDAVMGDGDLGITMSKGYGALPDFFRENTDAENLGKTIMKAGIKLSGVVPSTMGTLMASGLMQGGKQLDGKTSIGSMELADFFAGFAAGIRKRGKCQSGDRTIFDALDP